MSLRERLEEKKDEIINTMSMYLTNAAMLVLEELLTEFIDLAVENASITLSPEALAAGFNDALSPVLDLQLQMSSLLVAAFGGKPTRRK